jgi:murein DD-endopeptidase MepM/ murein hydrolase activator NlpD
MSRFFPLLKSEITINDSNTLFLQSYKEKTEIPVGNHPGSFGYVRKNHIHEGIDLYAEEGDEVISIEDGEIISIIPFTGEIANSPWWNNTYCVFIKHKDYVINYGELVPLQTLKVGDLIKGGQVIGNIRTVLLINKGRPMAMLHLEMYKLDTLYPITEWKLNTAKPDELLDPTELIKSLV